MERYWSSNRSMPISGEPRRRSSELSATKDQAIFSANLREKSWTVRPAPSHLTTTSTLTDSHRNFFAAIRYTVPHTSTSPVPTKVNKEPCDRRKWPVLGASPFPFDPDQSVHSRPAIWHPSVAPATVILTVPAEQYATPIIVRLFGLPVVEDHCLSDGRYMILSDRGRPHRVCLRIGLSIMDRGFDILADRCAPQRMAAAMRLHCLQTGLPNLPGVCRFLPTAFERRRLMMLLRILDMLQLSKTDRPTSRQIASQEIYRNTDLGTAAEWKSSSRRRHTLRLVQEARRMAESGYRSLLKANFRSARSNANSETSV